MNHTSENEIRDLFHKVELVEKEYGLSSHQDRSRILKNLEKTIISRKQDIREALKSDLGKPELETDYTEIYGVVHSIRYARKNLRKWMRPKRVQTALPLFGSSSFILYEPLGTSLIIAPWNFPILLTLGPVIGAIAAGNPFLVKPSEHSPASTDLLDEIISNCCSEIGAVIHGGIPETETLLDLPFKKIFFTGSTEVGKIVMKKASENLSSVTLELGGKSPVIIDDSADLKATIKSLAWGKWMNAGQTCVAPDYVLVDNKIKERFLSLLEKEVEKFKGNPEEPSPDYCSIVDQRHIERLEIFLHDLPEESITRIALDVRDKPETHFPFTIVRDITLDHRLMEEEIFGPILPVVSYDDLDEALEIINARERPLALYIFSDRKKNIRKILQMTRAGGTGINDIGGQFFNSKLPFGGLNDSGMGKAHGHFSFLAFSNQRGVIKRSFRYNWILLIAPPYNRLKQKIADIVLRWL